MAGGIFTSWGFSGDLPTTTALTATLWHNFYRRAIVQCGTGAVHQCEIPYADPVEYRIQQLERQIDYILQETGIKKIGG